MWSMFKNLVITEQDFIHIMETRKRSADDQDDQSSGKQFQIRWHGLSYFAHKSWLQRQIAHLSGHKNVPPSKRILNNISGLVKSGELTAIMGPSGAGKSTLLECLAGIRNEGRNGDFMVDGHKRKLKMSFIPQHDTYFGVLTVKETVVFACKLKQSTAVHNKEDYKSVILNNTGATNGVQKVHREATITDEGYYFDVADNILKALGLYEVRNVLVNSISGGQQKRVSIAQELVSKPDVLILDEPTSGLDSSSALLCIQLLRSITEQRHPMAILLTIHQPNPKIFHLLHKIYVLAVTGQCIYEDSPIALVDHLKSVCIECPIFYNPADFIIEVANSEHGLEKIDQLALTHQTQATSTHGGVSLQKILAYPKYPFFKHFWYLFHRCTLVTLRDPVTLYLRFGSMLFMPIFTAYIYGHNSGHATGCPANITISLDAEYFTEATARRWREAHAVTNNSSFLFFSMISLTFLSMIPTILSFPLSMNVLLKEKRNSWYSVGPAYLSLSLADAPFQLSFTLIFIIISYFGTGQVMEEWRFLSFTYIFVMVAFIGQANGFIVGALFMENVSVAIFLGPLMAISALMVSGFAVRVSIMPRIFQIMSSGSYFRYTLEALILTMYGFDRCADIGAKIANTRQMFTSWIKRMMDIVEVALNGNDEDDDYEGGVQPNGNQTNDVGQMSEIIADTIIAGIGGRKSADSGKIESLIVNHFDLKNEEYNNCIVQLLIAFITLRILAYFAVIWKTRNS